MSPKLYMHLQVMAWNLIYSKEFGLDQSEISVTTAQVLGFFTMSNLEIVQIIRIVVYMAFGDCWRRKKSAPENHGFGQY